MSITQFRGLPFFLLWGGKEIFLKLSSVRLYGYSAWQTASWQPAHLQRTEGGQKAALTWLSVEFFCKGSCWRNTCKKSKEVKHSGNSCKNLEEVKRSAQRRSMGSKVSSSCWLSPVLCKCAGCWGHGGVGVPYICGFLKPWIWNLQIRGHPCNF